jgi:DNA repair photolyase
MMSANTDCYQPPERKFGLTREVLKVFLEYRNPVSILTKNALITRDIDIIKEMASMGLISTMLSITSLDPELRQKLEPRTSAVGMKYKAMEQLAKAGVPVGVMVGPIIPGLNDSEVPKILEQASNAGASFHAHTILRLAYSLKDIFRDWLTKNFPEKSERILKRVEMIRGGQLNDSRFGTRMMGEGAYADFMHTLFYQMTERYGLNNPRPGLRTDLFKRPGELF